MDEDVEMDAPQISILREEDSPPPQRNKPANSRKSKATAKVKTGEFPYLPRLRKESLSEEDYDEPEEEEDQLIDDDDDDMNKPAPTQIPGRSTEANLKRKGPSKRKPRKSDKKPDEEKKGKEKQQQQQAVSQTHEPSGMEPSPSETTGDATVMDTAMSTAQQGSSPPSLAEPSPIPKPAAASKKKSSPRKPPAVPRQRLKATNDKEKLKITIRPMLPPEDIEVASEGGHTATAASSPIAAAMEVNTPDVEQPALAPPSVLPPEEPLSLDNVPVPVYPLPTKPFPVQPPPKLSTGTAPTIPLDKTGKKVRHWRMAHREIRGIAGGRWFARTWVGGKESEYASAVAAAAKEGDDKGVSLPKLAASISAPVGGRGSTKNKGSKAASLAASATASAAPSRAGSAGPDGPISVSTVRAPTKMRIQLGPDEYGD
ncbi:hypothetical protein AX17_000470 [Amanita inopinata Kibby_2008]|nr:hypothetical protein AX17_000470 [Amanita inopinata Kibby_2008]